MNETVKNDEIKVYGIKTKLMVFTFVLILTIGGLSLFTYIMFVSLGGFN